MCCDLGEIHCVCLWYFQRLVVGEVLLCGCDCDGGAGAHRRIGVVGPPLLEDLYLATRSLFDIEADLFLVFGGVVPQQRPFFARPLEERLPRPAVLVGVVFQQATDREIEREQHGDGELHLHKIAQVHANVEPTQAVEFFAEGGVLQGHVNCEHSFLGAGAEVEVFGAGRVAPRVEYVLQIALHLVQMAHCQVVLYHELVVEDLVHLGHFAVDWGRHKVVWDHRRVFDGDGEVLV